MQKILGLRKDKLPTVLSETETELLKKINIGTSPTIQKRYDKLLKIKQKEILSEQEYDELLELLSRSITVGAERLLKPRMGCLTSAQ